jgi:hypothetical protein
MNPYSDLRQYISSFLVHAIVDEIYVYIDCGGAVTRTLPAGHEGSQSNLVFNYESRNEF